MSPPVGVLLSKIRSALGLNGLRWTAHIMQNVVTTRQANVTAVLMTRSSGHGRLAQR